MTYEITLTVDLGKATISAMDRFDQPLDIDIQTDNGITVISTDIELPNKIKIYVEGVDSDHAVTLLGASLGGIKFNKNKLDKLFVYNHPYGQNRSISWQFNGFAEFDLFEHSAIKYHLIMGTTI